MTALATMLDAVVVASLLIGCGGDPARQVGPGGGGGTVTVRVEPQKTTLAEGDSTFLEVEVEASAGEPALSVSWSSTDSRVAAVDDEGMVVAGIVGTTQVVASTRSAADTATVRVTEQTREADPVIVEDFSDYSSTSELLNDPNDLYRDGEEIGTANLVLDTDVGVSNLGLSQSMRYDYDGVGTISRGFDLPGSGVNEVWIELWVRFSSNFRTDWVDSGSNPDFKFLFAVTDPSRFGIDTGSGGGAYDVQTPAGQAGTSATSRQDWDGKWHRYRIHFAHESSDGACDGTATVTIDNREAFGSTGTACTDRNVGEMFFLALGRNMNQTPSELVQLWWGRIAVWTSDPGW